MFPAITTEYIISQSVGLIAIVLVISSYFVSTKRKQLILGIIANIAIALSFLFLGTYAAFLGIVIATIRTIIFFVYELKLKEVPDWLVGIIFIVLVFNSAIFMTSIMDLMPMISLMLFTVGFKIRRLVYMRLFFIIPLTIFLIYDIYIFAYTDILLKILEFVAIGISTTRFYIRKTKLEKALAIEELQGEMEEISDD